MHNTNLQTGFSSSLAKFSERVTEMFQDIEENLTNNMSVQSIYSFENIENIVIHLEVGIKRGEV